MRATTSLMSRGAVLELEQSIVTQQSENYVHSVHLKFNILEAYPMVARVQISSEKIIEYTIANMVIGGKKSPPSANLKP